MTRFRTFSGIHQHNLFIEGFDESSGQLCLLQKDINGFQQSWREWYLWISNFPRSIDFVQNLPQITVLSGSEDEYMLVIYVDDIMDGQNKPKHERIQNLLKPQFKIIRLDQPKQWICFLWEQEERRSGAYFFVSRCSNENYKNRRTCQEAQQKRNSMLCLTE